MKTKESKIEKEIKKNGLTLFNYYYNYFDPDSDAGKWQELMKTYETRKNERRPNKWNTTLNLTLQKICSQDN